MMNNTLKAVLLTSMLPFAANAADGMSPWYVGGGVGINNYEPNCDQKTMKSCGEDDPYAWDVFAGYLLNDHFGIELGYRDLGRAEWVDYSNKLNDVGAKGMNLGVVAFWPFAGDWSLSAEAGAFNYLISNNKQWGTEYYSDSGVAPYVGAGIGYNITDNLKLQAKYRRYENLDEDKWKTLEMESNYWGLELSYRFGSKAKPVAPVIADSDNDGVTDDLDQCPNTPVTYKVDANGCPIYLEVETQLDIEAKFANNSAEVEKSSYGAMTELATYLKQHPNSTVTISGYASNTGKADYNMKLSERRAAGVAEVLINEYGIAPNRVSSKGYGITRPLMEGNSAEANAANRRIEAHVTDIAVTPVLK
ncbi:OmpA family protein [Shewanella schlegeliana]|uniref:OmpA family protein n=1 Tax=Shewanella schlegeliana TaxID=190308 RepID=A0ABS1SUD3_9GAMM|nr:OmpA family protein [Shewanella schlegeliana]MBL4912143.1 OmpA family protein [Shewanella schlegeliana]MCL1110771.1 OmpA family protein [Shewanella schlegeliana]GIU22862.1 porin [Shewanella schlegeliana]